MAPSATDRRAFGRLFERYAKMVHGVLLARVPKADADDLVQEVFITAMQRLETLRDEASMGGWLAAIARNRAIDFVRGRPQLVPLPETLEVVDPRRAEVSQVLALIRSLPEAYREPLALRLVEGLTGPEIAEQVGLTPESVRVNLCRGMKLLRERMGLSAQPGEDV
ncbi:MAG: sigma-70 family RNA polymerase sigma factor [Myxococcaceae bacterium]|nr:sigma-70 family RNA polymerase sigma factor [Myxococcaceae bacterium]